jgi:hypothetical protein
LGSADADQAGNGTDPATWRVATLSRLKTMITPIGTSSEARSAAVTREAAGM